MKLENKALPWFDVRDRNVFSVGAKGENPRDQYNERIPVHTN